MKFGEYKMCLKKKKYKYITKGKNFSFVFLYTKIQQGKKIKNNDSTSTLELLLLSLVLKSYFFPDIFPPMTDPVQSGATLQANLLFRLLWFFVLQEASLEEGDLTLQLTFPFWCAAFNLQLMTLALSAHLDSLSENLNNLYPWVPARQINSAIKPFALCLFIKFKSCDLFSLQADNCWHMKVHNWAGPHLLSSYRDIFPATVIACGSLTDG